MPSVNSKISIQDFNPIRDKVVAVLGQGSVDRGYGQVTQSQPVSESSKISINDWTNLRFDIINAYKHIYGSNPVTAVVSEGNTIRYTTSFAPDTGLLDVPQFQYAQYADQIDANRFTIALGESGTTPVLSSSRNGSWEAECACIITFNWTNATQARHWFNSGGRIKISASRTGGSVSTQNTNWTNLLSAAGVVEFGGAFPSAGTTSNNGTNWYRTTNQFQPYSTTPGTGAYAANQFTVAARCVDAASNSQGTAAQCEIRVRFQDLYSGAQDDVDGVLAVSVFTQFAAQTQLVPGSGVFTVVQPVIVQGAVVEVPPTYAISASAASVNEGVAVTFTVTTSLVGNGTTLYWTTNSVLGTINAADFTDGQLTGSFSINNNSGTVTRTITADATTEGIERFTLSIRTGSINGTVQVTSGEVTINDTSLDPTYAISASAASVNEGASVTFTVTTTDVANGPLYWSTLTVSGAITGSDFTDGLLMGSFSINNNSGSITRSITADATLEGPESFQLQIRTVSISGTVQVTSDTVTINDTSVAPIYAISASAASVNEGSFVTFNVSTVGVADGTPLYWTTNPVAGTINAADFTDGQLTGSFSINSNAGTVTRTITADATTEGPERFTLSIRTGSINGTVRATSSEVTINDNSLTPSYAISASTTSVNESASVTFTVTTANVANSTLYWSTLTVSGAITASDFTDGLLSGSFSINNNLGSITRSITADVTTEGVESFQLQIRTGSTSGPEQVRSSEVTINDTSLAPLVLNIGFSVSYNYKFPPYEVEGGYQFQGGTTYTDETQTRAYYATVSNNTGLANSAISATLNTGGLVLQGIQPPRAWTLQDYANERPNYGRQPFSTSNVFGNSVQGGGPVIFVFQAPHNAVTITLTASAAGYASYNQSRSVSANTLYSPYSVGNGLAQDTRYPFITVDLNRAEQMEAYYTGNNLYVLPAGLYPGMPGGNYWGLLRSADLAGVEGWINFAVNSGYAIPSQQMTNAFFAAVWVNQYEYVGRADRPNKGFTPGPGWNRFFHAPGS